MKRIFIAIVCSATIGFAHNSYTGGYSGAPGRSTCASSCHGGTAGTLIVTGFPATYQPGQTYIITVAHNGGSPIVNFNATTRIGTTTNVAGTFANILNSALYTGADGGVYASPHAIDSAKFQWTAPAAGTGQVKFYAAAFQGTTSSRNGQSSTVTTTSSESTTDVEGEEESPLEFGLEQNFPNPFNPTTQIGFEVSNPGFVTIRVFDLAGNEVATLVQGFFQAGHHQAIFNASNLASGLYMYRLEAGATSLTKKMVLLK